MDRLAVFYSHRPRQTPLVSSICNYLIGLPPTVIVQQKNATPKGPANKIEWYLSNHMRRCRTIYQSGSMYSTLPSDYRALAILMRDVGGAGRLRKISYISLCRDLRKRPSPTSLFTASATVDFPLVPAAIAMEYICITQCSLPH